MKEKIVKILEQAVGGALPTIEILVPEKENFGHYATNIAMRLSGAEKPLARATRLAAEVAKAAPKGFFEKVEAAEPGFINFWLSKKTVQGEIKKIAGDEHYGVSKNMKGKTVMVEFTDPNPFKLFHIGHLMSNAIGESFARLYEALGAKVIRANYQGDVGLHVAKAIWGMQKMQSEASSVENKMEFLGRAYALGSKAYEGESDAKEAIIGINEKIYSRTDQEINKLYDEGRKWSLAYFETVYARLGTKFNDYFYEGEMAKEGMAVVAAHKDIFIESDGVIVFPGEKYGLHTRVFVNSKGLPTYEAKELGLNKKKFELYPLDLSVIVTGNEINDYFKVLLKVMELIFPEVAAKTRHVGHGMLRLPSGKMASRTGDVIIAESMLDQVKAKLREHISEKSDLDEREREEVAESIAVGAVKYSILKQSPGQDIIFDFDKSLSFEGDSGPYVQYAYARLRSILRKSSIDLSGKTHGAEFHFEFLDTEVELALVRKLIELPSVVLRAGELNTPSGLVTYMYKLAVAANKFYETTPILKDENKERRDVRLLLAKVAADALKFSLDLLGIRAPEKI